MKRICLLNTILLTTLWISGQVINVPGDYSTIQAAIDSTAMGDTVLVAENTYYEKISFRGKAITLASHFLLDGDTSHISRTIIDGSQGPEEASVVTFEGCIDTTSVLAGFTITGGKGKTQKIGTNNIASAGGISISNAGGKVINNIICQNEIIEDDLTWAFGAGIGIGNFGEQFNLVIRNNKIHDNHTLSGSFSSGAGIIAHVNGSILLIENNEIFGNISKSTGTYKALGAGIIIEKDYGADARIIIRNNHIHHNQTICPASFGGGIYLVYTPGVEEAGPDTNVPVEIYNNIISDNYAEDKGGGVAIWNMNPIYGLEKTVPDPIISNNTIFNNSATDGAGIFNYDAQLVLYNNILWNDVSPEGCREVFNEDINYGNDWTKNKNDGIIIATYNVIQGGWEGEGNIDADPLLVDEGYELSDNSSCIGTGIDSVEVDGIWFRAPILDLQGSVRPNPVDNRVDMGAIESPFEWVDTTVAVRNLNFQQEPLIYPNPSKDYITLHLSNLRKYEINLISLSGQVVHSEIFSGNQHQIDLTGLTKGVYLFQVRSDAWVRTEKVVRY